MFSKFVEDPEEIGLSFQGLERAYRTLEKAVKEDAVTGAAIQVARDRGTLAPKAFGRRELKPNGLPVEPDTIFLTASITKPVTATAVMLLVDHGELCLDDPVRTIIPEFKGDGRERITLRHLLTHTSGLPDMLPENMELRAKHAGIEEFLKRIYRVPLLFEPGTKVSYQSCGFALLGEIVRRLTGKPLSEFMRKEIFEPLGMVDTSLGVNWDKAHRVSQVRVPSGSFEYGALNDDWNWNSAYWWNFGAPWGGMFSTVTDMTKFLKMFLNMGRLEDRKLLSPNSVKLMTNNQTNAMLRLQEEDRRGNPWGLGWRLKMPESSNFGDLVSPRTFGHSGATGTLMWADPEALLTCVIFTNQAGVNRHLLGRISNIIASSVLGE